MVHDLRGMFAFAIWDSRRGELFLARDPYGIKPLYYADDGWTFRFASQVKALLAGGAVSRDPEPAGSSGFYLWGSVPEPFTTYQAIRALPAGCTMRVDRDRRAEPERYHSHRGGLSRCAKADARRAARRMRSVAATGSRRPCWTASAIISSPTCRWAPSSPPASIPARSSG